jgi:hypothetical protein
MSKGSTDKHTVGSWEGHDYFSDFSPFWNYQKGRLIIFLFVGALCKIEALSSNVCSSALSMPPHTESAQALSGSPL